MLNDTMLHGLHLYQYFGYSQQKEKILIQVFQNEVNQNEVASPRALVSPLNFNYT